METAKLIEAIKQKNLVKAKKLFDGLMEAEKAAIVEDETKKVASYALKEDDMPNDDDEDDDSTDGKVDSSTPDDNEEDA